MADISNYSCFSCLPEHVGSQKCFVSNDLFAKLKVSLGQVVWVNLCGRTYLCTIWPRKDQYASHIYVDKTVQSQSDSRNDKQSQPSDSASPIVVASQEETACVSLDIILKNYAQVAYFKQNLLLLEEKVKELLYFTTVAPSCVVNADNLPLGTLYGIKFIVLSSADVNKFTCSSVSEHTKLSIKNIESSDRYQQRINYKDIELGGLIHAKAVFREMLEMVFTRREVFRELRIPCPQSVLLRGPPGTGKSSLVKLMAYQSAAYMLTVTGSDILASRPGETEDNLREKFHKALAMSEEGPCILFIDEIDSFCSKKGKGGGNEQRVLSQLLRLMDEVSWFLCIILVAMDPFA